jgi:hypothetical protein
MTNPTCAKCMESYNTINGRYCNPLGIYVEHLKEAPCITSNIINTNNTQEV